MTVVQAAVLGLVQGLTEFLPVSSSGHLILARMIMGISDEAAAGGSYLMLDILLHAGTLLAVAAVFWQDWWNMLKHLFRSRLFLLLIVASIPALIADLLLGDLIKGLMTGWFLGVSFLMTALFLSIAEYAAHRRGEDGRAEPGFGNAIVMGCMQAVALVPGVGRSGSAMTGGLLSGLNRQAAAKFSFMMSAPAILGSLIFEGKDALESGLLQQTAVIPTAVGVAVAAVSGFLAIRLMLRLIQRISLTWFALYAALLGLAILCLQLAGYPGVPAFSISNLIPAAAPLG